MPFLELEHSLIHYEEYGEGHPLVLLHGACENSRFWKSQLDNLQKSYHLILLDLPGHGQSPRLGEEVSIEIYARIVTDLIQGLELENPILAGHSMGGAIALTMALKNPSLLGGLVLANTGAKLGVLPQIIAGLETDFAETIRGAIAPKELGVAHRDSLLEWISDEMILTEPKVGLEDFLACTAFDVRNRLKDIRAPTLVVSGNEDQLTPLKWSVFLNDNIKDSTLAVIQRTGHLTMLERPDIFNEALLDFASTLSL